MSRTNPHVGAGLCACPGQPHWIAPTFIDRRRFLVSAGMAALGVTTGTIAEGVGYEQKKAGHDKLPADWLNTPVEFSLCPFWFWNDELSEKEIARQIEDFRAHGVYGFVIHPRAGLPKSIGWMSLFSNDASRL